MSPEAFRQKFEAYIRSQCPEGHPDPEEFVHYYGRLPSDDRDGNFTATYNRPRLQIFREHGAWPGEPTTETIVLAHEFGHFRSWQDKTQEDRDKHEKIVEKGRTLTESGQDEILAEERRAWDFARSELASQGFEAWDDFDRYRKIGVDAYLRRFGRAS